MPHRHACILAASVAGGAGCTMGSPASPPFDRPWEPAAPGPSAPPPPAEATSPYSYVAKVKNVLTGMPPTDGEVLSVVGAADPQAQLRTLVQGWMTLADPNSAEGMTYYAEKMLVFFERATQQSQIGASDFADQVHPGKVDVNAATVGWLVRNATESFARTTVHEVVDGTQPLTLVVTARSFMMTTALMELYAFLDGWQVGDDSSVVDAFLRAYPDAILTAGSEAVPTSQSVDPSSPNFMRWTDSDVAPGGPYASLLGPSECSTDPVTEPTTGLRLQYLLYGAVAAHTLPDLSVCPEWDGTALGTQVGNPSLGGADDFQDWRMVTVRQPAPGEATARFYDLASLRSATTLVLDLPRVGFFTTPAFFANWPTNPSNAMRVTTNQMLIGALGAMVDGTDATLSIVGDGGLPPGLDPEHAAPGTGCYACHQQLDPTRSILASTYSWYYHRQDDAAVSAQKGEFVFQGVVAYPQSVYDLAGVLASHPLFAGAWAQKLCMYANSQACDPSDPEFARIVDDFASSAFSWSELVVDLFSSPLTTGATPTQTAAHEGDVVAVSRRDHFCAAMDFRLGFDDVCARLPTTTPVSPVIARVAGGLPADGYGRGAVAPVLPNAPTLFYRSGTEVICEAIAALVIDVPSDARVSKRTWSSADPAAAIADFAQIVAGLVPSDPRYGPVLSILTSHYAASLAQPGASATSALQSTFVAACDAPSAVTIGQ
jgi:hypothetical protein